MEIEDTGIGVTKHNIAKTCERIAQTKPVCEHPQAPGSLAIVKSMCTAHAADIRIARTVGVGTKVAVEFRAAAVPAALNTAESIRDLK